MSKTMGENLIDTFKSQNVDYDYLIKFLALG